MRGTVMLSMVVALLSGCATTPPENPNNICDVFAEKGKWYKDAKASKKRWGIPISVMMAFAYQESSYKANIKPPRKKILGFIPGPRLSNSKGYSQATKETWSLYKDDAGNWGADRDDFGDAIDFIGWYNHLSHERNGISKSDPYHLYLAYHEGHGGFTRRTFKNKDWLIAVAKKVSIRSRLYSSQLKTCQKKLDGGFFKRLFGF